jgi:hypothetical protein
MPRQSVSWKTLAKAGGLLVVLVLSVLAGYLVKDPASAPRRLQLSSPEYWIAHGGGVGRFVYTNCREAVQDSLDNGFVYIELDLLTTSDGQLVGGHSWRELKHMIGASECSEAPMSRAEIEALRSRWLHTPLFAEGICRFLRENQHMVLVTDKVQDFELLRREIPFAERMLVEASDIANYARAREAGFPQVAMTAYTMQDLEIAARHRVPIVVLGAWLPELDPFSLPLIRKIRESGCFIMVHGSAISDKPEFIHAHLGKLVDRLYTDTWSPRNLPPQPER